MDIKRHDDVEKDLRILKRYPAAVESLEAWERLFVLKGIKETPGIVPYKGFGNEKVYKARVIPLKEHVGKSKGYRLIFQLSERAAKILVFSRHGVYAHEQELINLVRMRLSS